jgi:hypothetical protein
MTTQIIHWKPNHYMTHRTDAIAAPHDAIARRLLSTSVNAPCFDVDAALWKDTHTLVAGRAQTR